MNMKFKKVTYGEFEEGFGGLKRLTVNRVDGVLSINYGIVPIKYLANICYKRKKDCTYVAITCLGYLAMFRPTDDKPTIICKFEGRVTADDLVSKDFIYKEQLEAITEELYNDWKRDLENKD